MCVLPMGLKADLSDFEQSKYAYESGRSIGGVYIFGEAVLTMELPRRYATPP
jgi:hypothetical protein